MMEKTWNSNKLPLKDFRDLLRRKLQKSTKVTLLLSSLKCALFFLNDLLLFQESLRSGTNTTAQLTQNQNTIREFTAKKLKTFTTKLPVWLLPVLPPPPHEFTSHRPLVCCSKLIGTEEAWFKMDDNVDYHSERPKSRVTTVQGHEIVEKMEKMNSNDW